MANPEAIKEYNKQSAIISRQAAALAQARSKHKYKQSDIYEIMQRLTDYVEDCQSRRQPLTAAGFVLASGLPQSTWYDAKDGQLDSITTLYQMEHDYTDDDGNPLYIDETTGEAKPLVRLSEVCKNAYLMLQAQLETNCYTNKGNPAGSIFGLKAQFGWQDDAPPRQLTQNLVICDAEQARKALAMLD